MKDRKNGFEDLLTTRQVVQAINDDLQWQISPKAFWALRMKGHGPIARKAGRAVLYRWGDVVQWYTEFHLPDRTEWVDRQAIAEILTAAGFAISHARLNNMACYDGGPPFRKFRRLDKAGRWRLTAYYHILATLRWAADRAKKKSPR